MKRALASFALAVVAAGLAYTPRAAAFCGFYVGGADAKLFNNATQVVLLRDGTRTVLSMQNDYQGPPDAFAMVVPVPVVLQKENVKTLSKDVFDRVDKLTAPRLVEYWEQDPCAQPDSPWPGVPAPGAPSFIRVENNMVSLGVTVEAKFTVGEYDIVILSAKDSTGLDTWLRHEKYKIPEGAEPYLKPYVQNGSKFFVAKVDAKKVKMENGHAALSPLRFHYDSNEFSLPVRLGLINSSGTQDLIVNVLAQNQRYEPANYPAVTIPTNLDLADEAAASFGPFYTALFDRTLEHNKGAIVTEYSWDASSCDPCPGPALQQTDFATLGADAVPGSGPPLPRVESVAAVSTALGPYTSQVSMSVQRCWAQTLASKPQTKGGRFDIKVSPRPGPTGVIATAVKNESGENELAKCVTKEVEPMFTNIRPSTDTIVSFKLSSSPQLRMWGWTITRLHARYSKDALGQDIVFKAAPPITGGREVRGPDGALEHGASPASMNNFQGRYAIRHPWKGPIACANPRRGVWGGPPSGVPGSTMPRAAQDLAFVARGGVSLPSFLRSDVPELGLTGLARPLAQTTPAPSVSPSSTPPVVDAGPPGPPPEPRGCGGCTTGSGSSGASLVALLATALAAWRRRRAAQP
jgi:MYXO-CTERM domain-containing protein